jgi:hypothetical protein
VAAAGGRHTQRDHGHDSWWGARRVRFRRCRCEATYLTAVQPQFPPSTCLNPPSCSLQSQPVDAKGTSNLSTGAGSYHADLIIDFSPGGTCNIVTENATFSFGKGTISVYSHHEDCATAGLRIDTTFQVTGGTGAFQGASGSGREFSSVAAAAPVIYQGTISF